MTRSAGQGEPTSPDGPEDARIHENAENANGPENAEDPESPEAAENAGGPESPGLPDFAASPPAAHAPRDWRASSPDGAPSTEDGVQMPRRRPWFVAGAIAAVAVLVCAVALPFLLARPHTAGGSDSSTDPSTTREPEIVPTSAPTSGDGGSDSSQPSPTRRPTPIPTVSPRASGTSGTGDGDGGAEEGQEPPCTPEDLSMQVSGFDYWTGNGTAQIQAINISGETCFLSDAPDMDLFQGGDLIQLVIVHPRGAVTTAGVDPHATDGSADGPDEPHGASLAPGGSAMAGIAWPGYRNAADQTTPESVEVRIGLGQKPIEAPIVADADEAAPFDVKTGATIVIYDWEPA